MTLVGFLSGRFGLCSYWLIVPETFADFFDAIGYALAQLRQLFGAKQHENNNQYNDQFFDFTYSKHICPTITIYC